ncbi:MAG: hypothetical protein BLITH_0958 [Brockia lithotrophica]|uniref:Uncharacterized protein n=1 Tax=Brockia lithotrophica TaxID=933949 RepID=A0A2T5G724_9BACL|nr:MAG: hypothetical protein BLITH_0958 [Brockia lithotrophica]
MCAFGVAPSRTAPDTSPHLLVSSLVETSRGAWAKGSASLQ